MKRVKKAKAAGGRPAPAPRGGRPPRKSRRGAGVDAPPPDADGAAVGSRPPEPAPTGGVVAGGKPPRTERLGEGPVDLEACQERIGYRFRDTSLLLAALTHASGALHRLASNERLEFLGDAILGFIVCERLYGLFPESLEGDLTRIKSVVVSRETCGRISERLGLTDFLIVGKGLATNRSVPASVLSDLFESVVAAVYLDGGIDPVRVLVGRWLEPEILDVSSGAQGANHKSLLQQIAQRDFGVTPTYEVVEEAGPDHSKTFHVSAFVGDRQYAPAWGRNKKEAEQRAAANALVELRVGEAEEPPASRG